MRTKERNQRKFVYGCGVWARVCVSGAWKYTQQQQHSILFNSNSLCFDCSYKYLYNTYLWICERVQKPAEHYSQRSCNSQNFLGSFVKWSAPNSDSLKLDFFRCCWCCFGSSKPKREQNEKFYIILCNVYVFLYNQMVVFRYSIRERVCIYEVLMFMLYDTESFIDFGSNGNTFSTFWLDFY